MIISQQMIGAIEKGLFIEALKYLIYDQTVEVIWLFVAMMLS